MNNMIKCFLAKGGCNRKCVGCKQLEFYISAKILVKSANVTYQDNVVKVIFTKERC